MDKLKLFQTFSREAPMLQYDRRQSILQYLEEHHSAKIAQLAAGIYTSEASVRRDLAALEAEGLVQRVYGGVVLAQFKNDVIPPELRDSANSANKRCKISGKDTVKSGIKDIVSKLINCISNGETIDSPIVNSYFIELLYTMCNIDTFDTIKSRDHKVQNAIDYINLNFCSPITLDDVSKNIFISKYHLCRMFKNATGYTVNGYINHRRLMFVDELVRSGNHNLREASMLAGFGSYTNFYRLYKKENRISPKEGVK